MEPGIDPRIPLEAGDGSQQKHFIIPFINWALRPAGCLCGEGVVFLKAAALYCSVFIIFCMGASPARGGIISRGVMDPSRLMLQPQSVPPRVVSSPRSSKRHNVAAVFFGGGGTLWFGAAFM